MSAIFGDKAGAGKCGAVHADGKVLPCCQVGGALHAERDVAAVERPPKEDAEALAVGINVESAAGLAGSRDGREKAEGIFCQVVIAVVVVIAVRQRAGIAKFRRRPLCKSGTRGGDDANDAGGVEIGEIEAESRRERAVIVDGDAAKRAGMARGIKVED